LIADASSRDPFIQRLESVAQSFPLWNAIEIGPKVGESVTGALISGLSANAGTPRLFIVDSAGARAPALRSLYGATPFVHVYHGPAANADQLPTAHQLAQFLAERKSAPQHQPLIDMIKALSRARGEIKTSDRSLHALDQIAREFGAVDFDLAVFDGTQFAAAAELDRLYGATHVFLTGTAYFAGYQAWCRLMEDPAYELVYEDRNLRNGAAVFRRRTAMADLPIHFFTIVLNGEPWIRYHEHVFRNLPFRWQWHVVEGVASLVHDTAWSVAGGGRIVDSIHTRGRSIDGTTEYLDDLAQRLPDNVKVYRKPLDEFWDGKREMVNAPIPKIREQCLLWQVDCDELWTFDQITAMQRAFKENPTRTAARFWCKYFVGPDKGIATRYNYAQNPNQEWLRVWRFDPGMQWVKHEPPVLGRRVGETTEWQDVAAVHPFNQDETDARGLVFEHYAYVTRAQAEFKETYYGYAGAVEKWRALQAYAGPPQKLRRFLDWVTDDTIVADCSRMGWTPIAKADPVTGRWQFRDPEQVKLESRSARQRAVVNGRMRILVDSVYFQMMKSGIGRYWLSLIEEWKKTGFIENIVVLDRAGTCPRVEGVTYRSIKAHRIDPVGEDAAYLQSICDQENADLLVSTYYTTPTRTPTVFMGYDMIPEWMGVGLDDLWWQQKRRAIQYAAGHVTISHSSARDLVRFFPGIALNNVVVAYCSVADEFHEATADEVAAFRREQGLNDRYVLMVGDRRGWHGYKNGILAFAGIAHLNSSERPAIVCIGGTPEIEPEYREVLPDADIRRLALDDDRLRAAFGGAHALIYPSSYEGFGLPIAEAIACGCPVVTCENSSIPEVAGDGAVYVDPHQPQEVADALRKLGDPAYRAERIEAGFKHIQRFNAAASAQLVANFYGKTVAKLREGVLQNPAIGLEDVFKTLSQVARLESERTAVGQEIFKIKNDAAMLEAALRSGEAKSPALPPGEVRATVIEAHPFQSDAEPVELAELKRRILELTNALQGERDQVHRLSALTQQYEELLAGMRHSPFWKVRDHTVSALRALRLRHRS
jgi:glycosyltransferase involved in cell wall biosynthesis